MSVRIVYLFIWAFIFISIEATISAQVHAKRVALVIGNDNYQTVTKLNKAVSDAKAVSSALGALGFEVTHLENLKSRDMTREIFATFISKINRDDEVLFYYAGHGIEIRSRNYLLATDIPKVKPGSERFVTKEAFAVDEIIQAIQEKGTRLAILILDACRDNPFPKEGTRSLGTTRGLGRTDPPKGTFVMYSAGSRQAALDRLSNQDSNPNSVYTRKLLPLLKSPGLKLTDMAKRLRSEVEELARTVNHDQYPAYYDQMRGEFYFNPAAAAKPKSNDKTGSEKEQQIAALQQRLDELEAKLQHKEAPPEKQPPTKVQKPKKPLEKQPEEKDTAALTPKAKAVTIAQHLEFLNAVYTKVGLTEKAFSRSAYGSCAGCVPFIFFCRKPLKSITDLKGLHVAPNRNAKELVLKYGAKPVIIPMSEVVSALKTGLIECKISGGGKPEFALDGPMPPGWQKAGLPKSRLK